MDAPNDNTTPSRSGMQRLISPWKYRHLRFGAGVRFAVGIGLVGGAAIALSYDSYGWAVPLLLAAALNFSFGFWEMTVARSASPRT